MNASAKGQFTEWVPAGKRWAAHSAPGGTHTGPFHPKNRGAIDAAQAIPRFDRPVLLIWGESCGFFPMAHARRLAADFPRATLVGVPGAKTWVPIDDPAAVSGAIAQFVPAPVP